MTQPAYEISHLEINCLFYPDCKFTAEGSWSDPDAVIEVLQEHLANTLSHRNWNSTEEESEVVDVDDCVIFNKEYCLGCKTIVLDVGPPPKNTRRVFDPSNESSSTSETEGGIYEGLHTTTVNRIDRREQLRVRVGQFDTETLPRVVCKKCRQDGVEDYGEEQVVPNK